MDVSIKRHTSLHNKPSRVKSPSVGMFIFLLAEFPSWQDFCFSWIALSYFTSFMAACQDLRWIEFHQIHHLHHVKCSKLVLLGHCKHSQIFKGDWNSRRRWYSWLDWFHSSRTCIPTKRCKINFPIFFYQAFLPLFLKIIFSDFNLTLLRFLLEYQTRKYNTERQRIDTVMIPFGWIWFTALCICLFSGL